MNTQTMHNAITAEFDRYKLNKTTRSHRMAFAESLTEQYFAEHDQMPDGSVLDRLATLILQDELADMNEYKMSHNEYPLLSDRQQERRHIGERSIKAAQDVAVDGTDYRVKTRDSNRRLREIFG